MTPINGHKINPVNELITLEAGDPDPASGAAYSYRVVDNKGGGYFIEFHRGELDPETGPTGITNEVLLAILLDRLGGFAAGPLGDKYTRAALHHLLSARNTLLERTRERQHLGIEGTHAPTPPGERVPDMPPDTPVPPRAG